MAELERAQFIRNTEEGFKLLTVQEKQWETQRNSLSPREADRHRIHRESIGDLFAEPKLRSMVYKNLRSFRLGITVDGQSVESDGDIPLQMSLVTSGRVDDDPDRDPERKRRQAERVVLGGCRG